MANVRVSWQSVVDLRVGWELARTHDWPSLGCGSSAAAAAAGHHASFGHSRTLISGAHPRVCVRINDFVNRIFNN